MTNNMEWAGAISLIALWSLHASPGILSKIILCEKQAIVLLKLLSSRFLLHCTEPIPDTINIMQW